MDLIEVLALQDVDVEVEFDTEVLPASFDSAGC